MFLAMVTVFCPTVSVFSIVLAAVSIFFAVDTAVSTFFAVETAFTPLTAKFAPALITPPVPIVPSVITKSSATSFVICCAP